MQRPICSVFIATSVDGCIARPDGRIDFLDGVQLEGEDYGFAAFYASVDALVMGRGTWDVVNAFPEWPYEGKRVVVLTDRPAEPRRGETIASGGVVSLLERLHAEGVRRVYVDGGVVIRQFLAAGVVDDLVLSVIPVILGDGVRLFGAGVPELSLTLVESRSWPTGLVQLRYQRTWRT